MQNHRSVNLCIGIIGLSIILVLFLFLKLNGGGSEHQHTDILDETPCQMYFSSPWESITIGILHLS